MRHGNNIRHQQNTGKQHETRGHVRALRKLERKAATEQSDAPETPGGRISEGRRDVPALPFFYNAYQGAKTGHSFMNYTKNCSLLRISGSVVNTGHDSRFVAKNLAEVFAQELRHEDELLLKAATDIALTMDARKGMLVVRCRLTLGNGWPSGFGALLAHAGDSAGKSSTAGQHVGGATPTAGGHVGGMTSTAKRQIRCIFDAGIPVVDRMLALQREGAFSCTEDLANLLVKAVKDACRSNEVWEKVRRKVRVFCPDGAANEHLVGRLVAQTAFPKMQFVMRCAAHGIQNVIKVAWQLMQRHSISRKPS